MRLKQTPELLSFLSTYFPDADTEADEKVTRAFMDSAPDRISAVMTQARSLIAGSEDLPIDEFGSEANRWFSDSDEARTWLEGIVSILESGTAEIAHSDAPVKDSNGAVLVEGDSVQVIKDLKVRGGSSDLKRGTLIKKIHLIGDPDNIECRVDGSTLVLKTCFLKKV